MRPTPRFLVLDQGGQSSRALLYDAQGGLIRQATRAVATERPAPDRVEQDPEALVDTLRECATEALADGEGAAAAGLAVQRSSVVCWDARTGAALTPVLSWQDTRAHALFDEIALDAGAVRRTTGLPPTAHYGATKLAWCLRNVAAVRDAYDAGALRLGPLSAFLLDRLLEGRPYLATATLAQRTLLYDVHADDWSDLLLAAFGIPRPLLPALMPDCAPLGHLSGTAIPVMVCVGDQNAIPYAAGAPGAETLYLNAGTGAFVLRAIPHDADTPRGLLRSLLPRGGYAAEGTVNGAGSAVAWFENETRADFPWPALEALTTLPPGAPLFVNSVGDIGAPFWRTGVRARLEPDGGTAVERAYAVVESIAFLVRANVARMRDAGLGVPRVRMSGGLAASPFACRLVAAALDAPVDRSGDLEATARGVLTLLGGTADHAEPVEYRPERGWVAALDARYRAWLNIIAA